MTPTPWIAEIDDEYGSAYLSSSPGMNGDIATFWSYDDDAKYAARAVNNHQRLVDALKGMVGLVQLIHRHITHTDIRENHRYVEALATLRAIEGD